MKTRKNKYTAIKIMREIRHKINTETRGMSFKQFKEYIRNQMEAYKGSPIRQK